MAGNNILTGSATKPIRNFLEDQGSFPPTFHKRFYARLPVVKHWRKLILLSYRNILSID